MDILPIAKVAGFQTRDSIASGFNEAGAEIFTTRPTLVWRIPNRSTGIPVIYHDYRQAYTLQHPIARFYASIRRESSR